MTKNIPVIAVDGPSGVGKGTLCQALANHFNWHLLDSGAIYRVLALASRNIFTDAPVKIFLDASAQSRAERRMKQLQDKQIHAKFPEILQEITARDERDRNRAVAPLKPAVDALIIDTTSLSIEDVFNQAIMYIKEKLAL